MLDSYFFIPGDKQRFLSKIDELRPDFFVIDLEESVSSNNKLQAYNNIKELNIKENTFVRIPYMDNVYTDDQIIYLIERFHGRIILPKVKNALDLKRIISLNNWAFALNLIILIENPTCFVNLYDILKTNIKHIYAIGFGSHDFCSTLNSKHTIEHLSYYRKQLIVMAKAFNISYVDGVAMNIRDLSTFESECIFAFESGANGKFIIHPDQLKKINSINYFTKAEIEEMMEVNRIASSISNESLDVIEYKGEVYERPHLVRIKKIVDKFLINRE